MALYAIQFTPRATRQLEALPVSAQRRIRAKIDKLAENPRPPGHKALKGKHAGTTRVRVGAYRVLYRIDDPALIVLVVEVGDRKDVY